MEMGFGSLAALAGAVLLMMFHGLGSIEVLELEPAHARVAYQ